MKDKTNKTIFNKNISWLDNLTYEKALKINRIRNATISSGNATLRFLFCFLLFFIIVDEEV